MYSLALRDEIRTWVLIQGKSQRAAARHFGLSRNTVAKLLLEEPAANIRQYQRQAPCKTPVRDAALPHIEKWLKENEWLEHWAPKQSWTAHRMWVELHKLGIPIWRIDRAHVRAREAKALRSPPTFPSTSRQASGQSLTLARRP